MKKKIVFNQKGLFYKKNKIEILGEIENKIFFCIQPIVTVGLLYGFYLFFNTIIC